MSRLSTTKSPGQHSRRFSEVVIALATFALIVMMADMMAHPAGNGAQELALLQLVLALVSLVIGTIYLFGNRGDGKENRDADTIIDLRDPQRSGLPHPLPPRQVPDARAANVFG